MTGFLNRSARLKAQTVSSKHSRTVDGARAMMGWSPWVPQRACITSPWAGKVGSPVDGPPRMTLATTQGTSAITAKPRFSCMREKPGPDVAVIDLTPASDAPMIAPMLAISSSIWMNVPPSAGSLTESISDISVAGVMG